MRTCEYNLCRRDARRNFRAAPRVTMMLSVTGARIRMLCLLAITLIGCDGGDAGPAPDQLEIPGGATVLTREMVVPVPGISMHVARGEVSFTLGDEADTLHITVEGEATVIDGQVCMFCFERTRLGPGAAVADTLFADSDSPDPNAASLGVEMDLSTSLYPEGAQLYLVAGPDGAELTKEGGGFRLRRGTAWLQEGPPED